MAHFLSVILYILSYLLCICPWSVIWLLCKELGALKKLKSFYLDIKTNFIILWSSCHPFEYLFCISLTSACCKYTLRPSIVAKLVMLTITCWYSKKSWDIVMAASVLEDNIATKILLRKQRYLDKLVIVIPNIFCKATKDPLIHYHVRHGPISSLRWINLFLPCYLLLQQYIYFY